MSVYFEIVRQVESDTSAGAYGSIRVRLDCIKAVGAPREIFMHIAQPSQYGPDGEPIGLHGGYMGVTRARDLSEYPAYRPDPQAVWAYSAREMIARLAANLGDRATGLYKLAELQSEADKLVRPAMIWPIYRLPHVDVRLRDRHELDIFLEDSQTRINQLKWKLEAEDQMVIGGTWAFGTPPDDGPGGSGSLG